MWHNARELCRDLQRGTISSVELTNEIYNRIEAINPVVNAIVGLIDRQQALALASDADQTPIANRGPLHGLPMATKDAVEVAGFATTWGFVPWAENIAKRDDKFAARMRQAGAFFIGRTNMPEFGLGSNTFNSLYGATLNPYDLTKTAGGSSGGAAVSLATEMLPLADGSDMGGSLRNPASFCNVVGFRPSIGRMPLTRGFGWLSRLSTTGPMAKNVADVALLFSIQAGTDPSDPLTLDEHGETFLDGMIAHESLVGKSIAFCPTLHGLPVEPQVMTVMQDAANVLSNLGAQVIETGPDLSQAMDVFQVQRAASLATLGNTLDRQIPDWKQAAKETAVGNIEKGQQLSTQELIESELKRTQIYAQTSEFFDKFDALVLPSAQVAPFPITTQWVTSINGTDMTSYIEWMSICCAITILGVPAISIPGGFTESGLPVGVQLVGKPRGDLELLRMAGCFEAATQHAKHAPSLAWSRRQAK
ncbi:MAG: amidase [Gammaproteobacteria bacterium]|nr:amidase [Gammaproteobacteria bacterium]